MSYYEAVYWWFWENRKTLSPLRRRVFLIWLRIMRREEVAVVTKMSFDEWILELKEIYAQKGCIVEEMDFSYETWKDYYEEDYSPWDAFDEECSRGD
ncbi:hypothetical protein ES708_02257 [subsurface metagenome]